MAKVRSASSHLFLVDVASHFVGGLFLVSTSNCRVGSSSLPFLWGCTFLPALLVDRVSRMLLSVGRSIVMCGEVWSDVLRPPFMDCVTVGGFNVKWITAAECPKSQVRLNLSHGGHLSVNLLGSSDGYFQCGSVQRCHDATFVEVEVRGKSSTIWYSIVSSVPSSLVFFHFGSTSSRWSMSIVAARGSQQCRALKLRRQVFDVKA